MSSADWKDQLRQRWKPIVHWYQTKGVAGPWGSRGAGDVVLARLGTGCEWS